MDGYSPLTFIIGAFMATEVINRILKRTFAQRYGPFRIALTLVGIATVFYVGWAGLNLIDRYNSVLAPGSKSSPSPTPTPTPAPTPSSARSRFPSNRNMESRHSASGNARLIGVQLSASNGQAAPEQIPQPIDTGDKRNTNGLPEKGYTFPAEQKRHCKVEGKRSS